ncbi:hypothetical protein JRQ81_010445 [Phrynocephalus forsythii]|uniref:Transmembrane protein 8A n=1 Tax=Phrynocephalus forsythii TaxID=171643 RepID=A0A9Q0X8P9_9SAUR|nr:hypothetical protein JRQ81_010445 [Phrynocephalus forsythii]
MGPLTGCGRPFLRLPLLLSLPPPLLLLLLLLLLPPRALAAALASSAPPLGREEQRPSDGDNGPDDGALVSEYFSQSAQKLSSYSWYGNVKVFRFQVPEDTVVLRWLLQASRVKTPNCGSTQITIHIRFGAPPVINPLGTQFPENTSVRLSYNQTLTLASSFQNSTFVNLSSPAAGGWFIAAHLPESTSKIEVQGFSVPCAYVFQPDMFVLRMVDVPVLEPSVPLLQTIAWPRRLVHAKIFVPGYSAMLHFQLASCTVNASSACSVRVTLGSATLPQSSQRVLNCTGPCSLLLDSPPWEKWLPITVESLHGSSRSVSLQMTASFTACRPGGSGSFLSFYQSLNLSQESPRPGGLPMATAQGLLRPASTVTLASGTCACTGSLSSGKTWTLSRCGSGSLASRKWPCRQNAQPSSS